MKILDKILIQIQDSKWHSLEEIKKCLYYPSDKLNMLLNFLENESFINIKKDRVKITSLGLKFLNL